MLVVSMRDAVLVANKNESQNVKKIVNMLKEKKYDQGVSQKKDFRPWGNFESLLIEEDFHVKILNVKSGESLSLQSHNHYS